MAILPALHCLPAWTLQAEEGEEALEVAEAHRLADKEPKRRVAGFDDGVAEAMPKGDQDDGGTAGHVRLRHTLFEKRETRRIVAFVPRALGVSPHQRIDGDLELRVDRAVGILSHESCAAFVAGNQITRSMAVRCVDRTVAPQPPERDVPLKARVIHVHTDEEHAHTLGPGKSGRRKCVMMPVGVVATGMAPVCRNRLQNATFFGSDGGRRLTETMRGCVLRNYDMPCVEKIHIHGDGAPSIRNAFGDVVNVVHVLDMHHADEHPGW